MLGAKSLRHSNGKGCHGGRLVSADARRTGQTPQSFSHPPHALTTGRWCLSQRCLKARVLYNGCFHFWFGCKNIPDPIALGDFELFVDAQEILHVLLLEPCNMFQCAEVHGTWLTFQLLSFAFMVPLS